MSEEIKKHLKPLGASGTDVIGKIHNADDNITQLRSDHAAQIYDRMRRSDTQVRKVLSAINNPIKTANWRIDPATDEEQDVEAAALIQHILFDDILWFKFLNEALTYVAHGYSVFEVVHENKEDRNFGPYTGLAQLGFRRQTTIQEWCHNRKTGELEKIRQESNSDILVNTYIPADNLLIFYNEQEGDNIGFPLLRNLYGPYKRKLLATELQYIGIERFSIPTPKLKIPKGVKQSDQEYKEAVSVLSGFVAAENAYLTYPEGWELDLHNNVFDPSKVQVAIQAEKENMTDAILASFLELGIGGNGGAYALSNDQSDFFLGGIEYFANIIRDTLNKCLIPNLVKLNYGDELEALPSVQFSGISDKAGKELMEVITGYAGSNVITIDEQLEDHVRKAHKLPKKAEGEMLENQEAMDESTNNDDDPEPSNEPDSTTDDAASESEDSTTLKLAETVGHTHRGTGPAIQRGQKHFHNILDGDGNAVGRTQTAEDKPGHVHVIDANTSTGKPIETKEQPEAKQNPKKLIDLAAPRVAKVIRDNVDAISQKYINDVVNKYKGLPESEKLNATSGITIGGIAKFKKELKAAFTEAARLSLEMARAEVPEKANTKLSEYVADIPGHDTFKFNDFSKLPKRIQLLIANQVGLISDKEAKGVTDAVAFQFNSSEPSTNDIEVLRQDMENRAQEYSDSGERDLAANNVSSTVVNEARNTYLLDPEVSEAIASYTFINFDPKAEICKSLAGTTYAVNDKDLVRYQPPLHHNCKSYIRANLKTSKNNPDITGLPSLSKSAQDSVTLSEEE